MQGRWLCAFLAFILAITGSACGQTRLPADADLIARFTENKEAYEEAVEEFLAIGLYRFELTWDGERIYRPRSASPDSLGKLEELLVSSLRVDLLNASARADEFSGVNEIAFMHFRRGLVNAGLHKGIVFVRDESDIQLTSSLDAVHLGDEEYHGKRLYRIIEPHWYVFVEYFP